MGIGGLGAGTEEDMRNAANIPGDRAEAPPLRMAAKQQRPVGSL